MKKRVIDPGVFSVQVAADLRRGEFKTKNTILVENDVEVDFVFIGDSITHSCELNAYFGRDNKIIINRGISGDVTRYALKRFDADVIQLRPKYCICLIGINDAWDLEYNPVEHIEGKTVEEILNEAYTNYICMINKCKEANINFIICSVLPTNMTHTNRDHERNIYVFELNKKLKELCKREGLIYVDYYSEFVDENHRVKDGLTFEGLHPNAEGYNLMMRILKETLKRNDIDI